MSLPKRIGSNLAFSVPLFLLLVIGAGKAQAQGSSNPPMRDQVRAIQRAEMDRLLLMAVPAKGDTEAARVAVMKQIREDFKDLQGLNNKMMAEAWAREALDYSFISEMVSRIKGKAVRLKGNLSLPEADKAETVAADPHASNSREFRAALLVLDRTIMSFVNNPVFKEPNTVEVSQATKARQDLDSVIELAADLKKLATTMARVSPSR